LLIFFSHFFGHPLNQFLLQNNIQSPLAKVIEIIFRQYFLFAFGAPDVEFHALIGKVVFDQILSENRCLGAGIRLRVHL
jgi:hypothetical protein